MYNRVMTYKTPKILLILAVITSLAQAETPAYQLLSYPFSTRAAAMGGTRAVDPSGALDLQGNPASLSFVREPLAQLGFVKHLAGIRGYSMGGVLPLERHRLAGELIYFDYGLFDKTDVNGVSKGSFGYHELATSLSYAFTFSEGVRLGGRVGRFQREADSRSQGAFFYDLGAVYHKPLDSLSLGVTLASLGMGDSPEEFPVRLIIGSSKLLSHLPLRLNLDASYDFNQQVSFALGSEIFVHPDFQIRLGVSSNRLGLQTRVSAADFIAGISAGFVLNWQGMVIESASQSFGAAGWVSQLSLGYRL